MSHLICIEGQDGSGKNLLAKSMNDYLNTTTRRPSILLSSPDYDTISGKMLYCALYGEMGDFATMDPRSSSLLYAGNRIEQYNTEDVIRHSHKRNSFIIADRGWMSNIYFQGAKILYREIINMASAKGLARVQFVGFFNEITKDVEDEIRFAMDHNPDNPVMWAIRSNISGYRLYITRTPHEYLKIDKPEEVYITKQWSDRLTELSEFLANESRLEHPWISRFYKKINIDTIFCIYLSTVNDSQRVRQIELRENLDEHEKSLAYQLCVHEFAERLNTDTIPKFHKPNYIPDVYLLMLPYYADKAALDAKMASLPQRLLYERVQFPHREAYYDNREAWTSLTKLNYPELF